MIPSGREARGEPEQERDVKAQQPAIKETIQDVKYYISHDPKVVLHVPSRQKHLTLQTAHAHGPLHTVALTNKSMGGTQAPGWPPDPLRITKPFMNVPH